MCASGPHLKPMFKSLDRMVLAISTAMFLVKFCGLEAEHKSPCRPKGLVKYEIFSINLSCEQPQFWHSKKINFVQKTLL
jgi:hypothetical protein